MLSGVQREMDGEEASVKESKKSAFIAFFRRLNAINRAIAFIVSMTSD